MKIKYDQGALLKSATLATVSGLIPCAIGMFIAVSLGVFLELCECKTVIISFFLVYFFLIVSSSLPSLKQGPLDDGASLLIDKADLVLSTSVMLMVMNYVAFFTGVMTASSILSVVFILGFLTSLLVSFLATVPFNFWIVVQELEARR